MADAVSGNWCPHDIDRRWSRCGDCEAAETRGVIWDAASFVNRHLSQQQGELPPPKTAPQPAGWGRSAADWTGLAALAAEEAGRDVGSWIESKFCGRCICGEEWHPGELIRYDRDAEAWVCEACGS